MLLISVNTNGKRLSCFNEICLAGRRETREFIAGDKLIRTCGLTLTSGKQTCRSARCGGAAPLTGSQNPRLFIGDTGNEAEVVFPFLFLNKESPVFRFYLNRGLKSNDACQR